MDFKDILLSKKKKNPISKGHILYNLIYIALSTRKMYKDGEQISGCQGLEMEWGRRRVCLRGIFVVMQ